MWSEGLPNLAWTSRTGLGTSHCSHGKGQTLRRDPASSGPHTLSLQGLSLSSVVLLLPEDLPPYPSPLM